MSETSASTTAPFSLRRFGWAAFGPTAVWYTGAGAVFPVIALTARALGASVPTAAALVTVVGVAGVLATLPAGLLISRCGERWALAGAALLDAAAALVALLAPSLWVFAVAVATMGATAAVFFLARQSWLTASVPVHARARVMSTMGGVQRIGFFVGPLIAVPIIARWGVQAAYLIPVVAGVWAAVWAGVALDRFAEPADREMANDGTPADTAERQMRPQPTVRAMVREHRRVLSTLGITVLIIGIARSGREVVVPLWAESIGVSESSVALLFGVAGAAELVLFYPGGSLMDRRGRVWVAVPFMTLLGVSALVLPAVQSVAALAAVCVVMGLANGLGSGIVQTMGADVAPARGRPIFLSLWRLLGVAGSVIAPLLVAMIGAMAGLAAACVGFGIVVLSGVPMLARWLPAYDPRRR